MPASVRTTRTRLFAATTAALAALVLTGCEDGKGVRDEGPSELSKSSDSTTTARTTDLKAEARSTPCTPTHITTTATVVPRPLNHLLLTVTNTGAENCVLTGYPKTRFGAAQSVPPAAAETKPRTAITLSPGESGYAAVVLSAADGSGRNGYTATTLTVAFAAGGTASPTLPPGGVHVDDKLRVTYWQSDMDAALSY